MKINISALKLIIDKEFQDSFIMFFKLFFMSDHKSWQCIFIVQVLMVFDGFNAAESWLSSLSNHLSRRIDPEKNIYISMTLCLVCIFIIIYVFFKTMVALFFLLINLEKKLVFDCWPLTLALELDLAEGVLHIHNNLQSWR